MQEREVPQKKSKKWDASLIIAIMAVLISTISTYIGLKDSQIMLKQQNISLEQQAASVWPYLENTPINTFLGTLEVSFEYTVTNKGVGPAIIDSVVYKLDEIEIKGWNLGKALRKKYPQLKINQLGNAILAGRVLSPGEVHSVIKVQIKKEEGDTTDLSDLINNLNYHLEYCYCSIYGNCWKVINNKRTKSEDCQLKESLK